ncbi:hypothetical protein [Xenophilus sp. Marseille-Q4582]|uniref:hypothetical protein n=1 Tax=Xenophilus sp. Marseille-Q4582 TaxID=2866600 RepID=UPI001CE40690|nr:hypothetical protein [Xenophilus sp. Marseille-Q4582]
MAVLRITAFKGIFPSVSPRALPDDAAMVAENISSRVGEFLPRGTDQDLAAGLLGAKTIYRHSRTASGGFHADLTTGWRTNGKAMNIAKGQINDNTEDRLYMTAMDGSEPTSVITAAGAFRLVGVPAPAGIPAATVNVVDELTWEERNSGYETALTAAEQAIRANLSEKWVGIPRPGVGTPGVVDVSLTHFPEAVPFMVGRLYRLASSDGQISDAYTGADPTVMSWVMDPMLKGLNVGVLTSPPAWAGSSPHYGLGLYAYGRAYSIDKPAAAAALATITLPGGETMFPPDQIATIVNGIESVLDDNQGTVRSSKDAITNKMNEVLGLLAGGARSNLIAATAEFYAKGDVAGAINSALDTFTSEVYKQAVQVWSTPPTPVYDPGGAP